MQDKLNDLLQELHDQLNAARPAGAYEAAVHAAARAVYNELLVELAAGHEVHAEKGSGAILKIGAVGPLHGTTFPYARWHEANVTAADQSFERCELAVIRHFSREARP